MNHHSLIRLAAVLATIAVFAGCAELQEQLPPATAGGIQIHPDGWTVPASSAFHGKAIRADNWDMRSCQQCHGNLTSTTGGTSGVSCGTCHTGSSGAFGCRTCHGGTNAAPPQDLDGNTTVSSPGVGAHQPHVTASSFAKSISCSQCHLSPSSVYAAGHIDDTPGAEVQMNSGIAITPTNGVTPSPAYNATTHGCSGTYCHGSFTNGNPTNTPVWNSAAGTAATCGSCHGNTAGATVALQALPKTAPTGTHPNYTQCSWCHNAVVDDNTAFIDGTKHVDGIVQLYPNGGTVDCSHCHGVAPAGAPAGVHQAHIAATTAKPVKCAECHAVPTSIVYNSSDGHMEGTPGAEVAMLDTLARLVTQAGANVPNPTYTAATQTCGSTYCHGTFTYGNAGNAPTWTNPASGACGTCHGNGAGNPLPMSPHPQIASAVNCQNCHTVLGEPPVATYNGTTWTITNPSRHINGKANRSLEEYAFRTVRR